MRLQPMRRTTPPAVHTRQAPQQTPQKLPVQAPRHLPQQVLPQLVQPALSTACLQAHVPLGPLVAAKPPELGHTVPPEEGAIGPIVTEQVPLQGQQTGEVLALLENLEARMSLMSQMQETRQAIQRRAYAIEALQAAGEDAGGQHAVEEGAWTAAEGEVSMLDPAPVADPADVQREVLMEQLQAMETLQFQQQNAFKQVAAEATEGHAGEAVLGNASSSSDYFQHPAIKVEKKPWPLPSAACAPPFHAVARGANLALSDGGYLAERSQGCRQAVAIGSEPLQAQAWGWYFEVEVREVVDGWVGGLGIGFTGTPPSDLRRVPDKAWRLPRSAVIGYWGCVFVQGQERGTTWRADGLAEGSRVGVLATNEGRGDLIVFVNRRPVVRVAGALLGNSNSDINNGEDSANSGVPLWRLPLFPVVDVFAATRVVAVLREATPPPPPWYIDADMTSRSGSLCSAPVTPVSQQI